eukprot:8747185-Lingulodinium_polyedra.AAC.1
MVLGRPVQAAAGGAAPKTERERSSSSPFQHDPLQRSEARSKTLSARRMQQLAASARASDARARRAC